MHSVPQSALKVSFDSDVVEALVIGQAMLLPAQTFRTLYTFTTTKMDPGLHIDSPYTNSDGVAPNAGLVLLGNTLYGTARWGGSGAAGTVFAVNTDGSGFTNLDNFTYALAAQKRRVVWLFRPTRCLERPGTDMGPLQRQKQCSPLTPTARVFRLCMSSPLD